MNPQNKINHDDFQELHKHKGSENYEVIEVIPKQNEAGYFEVDRVNKNIFVNSFFEPKSREGEEIVYNTLKIDVLGKQLNTFEAHSKLKDATMWENKYYVNWIINGDTTKHKYIDPFSNKEIDNPYKFIAKEKDPDKWFKKFKELYNKSLYIYI